MRAFFYTIILISFSTSVFAQPIHGKHHRRDVALNHRRAIVKAYEDSLKNITIYRDSVDSVDNVMPNNPYMYKLFSPPMYYKSSVSHSFELDDTPNTSFSQDSVFAAMDRTFVNLYLYNSDAVKYTENDLKNAGGLRPDVVQEIKPVPQISKMTENFDVNSVEPGDWQIVPQKPNFWKFSGSYSLQFMQNYVSDNWYKGGESNHSMLAMANLSLVYNNKQKLKFENYLDLKLGFQYYKSDKMHRYRTNSDLIRMTNKVGLQAFKLWYYTFSLQSWTQFYPGYKNNNKKVFSDFMSPFESVFSVGMEYKLNVKNFNLSANLSPFACDFKYVDRLALSSSFGLKQGKHTKFGYGSTVTINSTWKIVKNINWTSPLYYYTDYSSARFEWENTYTFTINKYLSTKLFLYPRFDDSVYKKDESYLQFKEWLSLGLNASF